VDEEKKEKEWQPTEAQKVFAANVVVTNFENITESYRKAYPNASDKWASQDAYKLLRNPKIKGLIEQIAQDMRMKFTLLAPEAMARLAELAENADSEKVKLSANLEILDRAGLRAPDKIELSLPGVFGDASPEAIKAMIKDRQNVKEKAKEEMVKSE
jgi:phage terminase small subunit